VAITVDEADQAHARELTDRLQVSLSALTPNFRSTEEALALTAAARTTLGSDDPPPADRTAPATGVVAAARGPVAQLLGPDTRPVPLSRVAATARRLGAADADAVDRLVSLVARYQMLLASVWLDDDELRGDLRIRTLVRRLVVLGVIIVLLAPLAVAGLFANLVPVALVLVAGLVPNAPVTKGTVRLLVALVAFPVTWTVIALRDGTAGRLAEVARDITYPVDWFVGSSPADRGGTLPNLAVFLVAPLLAAVTLLVAERLGAFLKNLVTWRTLVDRRGQLPLVRERRADVVAATTELLRKAGDRA
jgi:hypothetical protein